MQLTDDERHLFEQLGRSPVFMRWIERELEPHMRVLKTNKQLESLLAAQGAVANLETIQSYCRLPAK